MKYSHHSTFLAGTESTWPKVQSRTILRKQMKFRCLMRTSQSKTWRKKQKNGKKYTWILLLLLPGISEVKEAHSVLMNKQFLLMQKKN